VTTRTTKGLGPPLGTTTKRGAGATEGEGAKRLTLRSKEVDRRSTDAEQVDT
jgi:hypothetical protein